MPDIGGTSIEISHKLNESREPESSHPALMHELLEIFEAIVLALVAIATAWSGYQAALWDGHQDLLYGESTKVRIEAQGIEALSNQERLYEASTVSEWLKAEASGNRRLAALFERRLLPEFRPAFEAWKKTDPLNNPRALAGPMLMPDYRNSKAEQATQLNRKSQQLFQEGTRSRGRSDGYVRVTVLLATVLLLTAISQRFRTHAVRVALIVVSTLLLCIPIYRILTLPRA